MSKYGVDYFAEKINNRSLDRSKKEDRIIATKREEIAFLDSRAFHFQSKERQKNLRASAFSLPLDCFGVVELVKIRDLRTGYIHNVAKSDVDDFFENYPRPNDLLVVKSGEED